MKKLICILLLMIPFITGYSQSIKIEEIGGELTSDEKQYIQTILEFELEFYQGIFELDTVFFRITLFDNFQKYKKYQKQVSSSAKSNTGFYSSSLKTVIIYKNDKFLKTINHEMSHLILRSVVNPVPKWVNEGLAEWFEYFYAFNNHVKEGIQNHKVARVKEWINKKELKLEEFLKYSNDKWKQKNLKPNYYSSSVSYCLVYFLYKENRIILNNLLIKIKNGKNSIEAFNSSYPGGIEKLQDDFENYFKN